VVECFSSSDHNDTEKSELAIWLLSKSPVTKSSHAKARSREENKPFHGFRVAQGAMGYCYEKFIAGMARSYRDIASFHCFRVCRDGRGRLL
jgi:hypothetical protein